MRSFSPRLAARALWQMRIRKRPYVLSHGVNARCNLRCSFCQYWREPGGEMTQKEIFRMLDEASSFGIGVYNAWTVEPLLREDLPQILRHAKSQGLITSLVTNGLLLAKRADELGDLDYLSVSVDGIKSYRELRGVDLENALAGIRAAKKAGHEILINCVISSKTRASWRIWSIWPKSWAPGSHLSPCMSPEEFRTRSGRTWESGIDLNMRRRCIG